MFSFLSGTYWKLTLLLNMLSNLNDDYCYYYYYYQPLLSPYLDLPNVEKVEVSLALCLLIRHDVGHLRSRQDLVAPWAIGISHLSYTRHIDVRP